jgi:phosphate transport system protein
MGMPSHTTHAFDADMRELNERFAAMAARCRSQLETALHAFWTRSRQEAESVSALDDRIDADEREIDALVLRILALRQPVASDLRVLTACLKLVTDLERIGDLAVNIADAAVQRGDDGYSPESVRRLAAATVAIVEKATDSFVRRDEAAADAIARAHGDIEALHAAVNDEMVAHVAKSAGAARSVVAAMNAARALERIADHAANLAEGTRFVLHDERMPR